MDSVCQLQRNKIQEILTAPVFQKPAEAPAEEAEAEEAAALSATAD